MHKIYSMLFAFFVVNGINSQTAVTIVADRDNSIYSESGTVSNGSGDNIFTGTTAQGNRRRSLIHFNLSAIPAGSVINSVSGSLFENKLPQASTGATTIELHKLTKDWGEGTSDPAGAEGTGAPATANDATWTSNLFNTSTWASPGGDFMAAISAGTSVTGTGAVAFNTTAALVADVQNWLNNASTNFGWVIISSAEGTASSARRFASRTNANTVQRPSITVTYTAGSLPVTLKVFSGALRNNQALLTWESATELNSHYYQVEHSDDGVNFISIGKVNATNNSTTSHSYSFTQNNLSSGKHYYRLAQYDLNGSVHYSQVIVLSIKSNVVLQIHPNPAKSFVKVIASTSVQGLAYVISSSAGQLIKKGVLNSQQIDVHDLRPGQYWLTFNSGKGETLRSAFIKE